MQPFSLDPSMLATIGGAFYPTGYSMVLFPKEADALLVGQRLIRDGMGAEDIFFLPPKTILSQIAPTVVQADDPLPSAGTEGATVRAYTKLALEGHAALLVKTHDSETAERLMEAVRTVPYAMAQRYRTLVIEDL
jgi:hypothetical protein